MTSLPATATGSSRVGGTTASASEASWWGSSRTIVMGHILPYIATCGASDPHAALHPAGTHAAAEGVLPSAAADHCSTQRGAINRPALR